MTKENLAIMFTDIVGSTELSQKLSQDLADDVRRGHFAVLRRSIAEAGGTEVKNLGDGLMVVFSSASAALACGVAMQQGVDLANRGATHPIGLRVGISGGEVVREEDDYFGDPVVEAARLCARCGSGQVLAAEIVPAMAGRRSKIGYRTLGEFELKGLSEPVATVDLLWEPIGGVTAGHAIPLPNRLAVRSDVGVVGRETEVGLGTDAYKRVAAVGDREIVLISGEAGLGKTTVAAEVARAAFDSGANVLFGHCEEELATPYQLFAEALGHYVTHAPEAELQAHIAAHGSELSRLVPSLASRIPDLPPTKSTDNDTERYSLFAAAVGLLAMVGGHRPLVIVLDDLQWADKGSLLLLRHLASSDTPLRLLILGTYRDSELPTAHALVETLAALRRQTGVSRIDLVGLDDTGVVELMEAAAGHVLDDAGVGLAHAIYRETDGNPFFVAEVLRNLVETGAIRQDAGGRWVPESTLDVTALPDSVREVIGARVLRLGNDAGRILSVAAVIGRDFDLDLLAASTNSDEDDVLDALDAATEVALVRELADAPGRFNFAHALIQHTLYEDLGATRRARAHRTVAEALEELCGDAPGPRVGELAHHWLNAPQPAGSAKAMDYAQRAGGAALAALAPDDAVRHFSQALRLVDQAALDGPQFECDVRLALGEAERQAGIPGFRQTFLDAARRAMQIGSTDRLVAAALGNTRGFFSSIGVIDADRVAVLEAALSALPDDDSNQRALLLATLCSELALGTTLERRKELADMARAMARRLGDPTTVVRTLNLVCDPLQVPSTLAERLVDVREAAELADALDNPDLRFWTSAYARMAAAQAGDFETSDRCLDAMRTVTSVLRQPGMLWVTHFNEAGGCILAGDHEQAERAASAALEVGTECGQPDAPSFYGAEMIGIRSQQGRLAELMPMMEQMAEDNPDLVVFRSTLAAGYLQSGDLESARHLLETAVADLASVPYDVLWIFSLANYAEVAAELRAEEPARRLLELIAPYDDQVLFIGATAGNSVAYHCASLESVLGRYVEAEVHFAMASEHHLRGGMKYSIALTDLQWGRMLCTRGGPGDFTRARQLLSRAQSAAEGLGYTSVAVRVSDALADLP